MLCFIASAHSPTLECLLNSLWQLGKKIQITNQRTNPVAVCQHCLHRNGRLCVLKGLLELPDPPWPLSLGLCLALVLLLSEKHLGFCSGSEGIDVLWAGRLQLPGPDTPQGLEHSRTIQSPAACWLWHCLCPSQKINWNIYLDNPRFNCPQNHFNGLGSIKWTDLFLWWKILHSPSFWGEIFHIPCFCGEKWMKEFLRNYHVEVTAEFSIQSELLLQTALAAKGMRRGKAEIQSGCPSASSESWNHCLCIPNPVWTVRY